MALAAFNLKHWIDEHRHLLKPPVGNKMIWQDTEFQVMIVGGPNARKDYHIEDGEELFFQIEGDIVVKVIEGGKPRDVVLKEGDIFLLPPESRIRRSARRAPSAWWSSGCASPRRSTTSPGSARVRRSAPRCDVPLQGPRDGAQADHRRVLRGRSRSARAGRAAWSCRSQSRRRRSRSGGRAPRPEESISTPTSSRRAFRT